MPVTTMSSLGVPPDLAVASLEALPPQSSRRYSAIFQKKYGFVGTERNWHLETITLSDHEYLSLNAVVPQAFFLCHKDLHLHGHGRGMNPDQRRAYQDTKWHSHASLILATYTKVPVELITEDYVLQFISLLKEFRTENMTRIRHSCDREFSRLLFSANLTDWGGRRFSSHHEVRQFASTAANAEWLENLERTLRQIYPSRGTMRQALALQLMTHFGVVVHPKDAVNGHDVSRSHFYFLINDGLNNFLSSYKRIIRTAREKLGTEAVVPFSLAAPALAPALQSPEQQLAAALLRMINTPGAKQALLRLNGVNGNAPQNVSAAANDIAAAVPAVLAALNRYGEDPLRNGHLQRHVNGALMGDANLRPPSVLNPPPQPVAPVNGRLAPVNGREDDGSVPSDDNDPDSEFYPDDGDVASDDNFLEFGGTRQRARAEVEDIRRRARDALQPLPPVNRTPVSTEPNTVRRDLELIRARALGGAERPRIPSVEAIEQEPTSLATTQFVDVLSVPQVQQDVTTTTVVAADAAAVASGGAEHERWQRIRVQEKRDLDDHIHRVRMEERARLEERASLEKLARVEERARIQERTLLKERVRLQERARLEEKAMRRIASFTRNYRSHKRARLSGPPNPTADSSVTISATDTESEVELLPVGRPLLESFPDLEDDSSRDEVIEDFDLPMSPMGKKGRKKQTRENDPTLAWLKKMPKADVPDPYPKKKKKAGLKTTGLESHGVPPIQKQAHNETTAATGADKINSKKKVPDNTKKPKSVTAPLSQRSLMHNEGLVTDSVTLTRDNAESSWGFTLNQQTLKIGSVKPGTPAAASPLCVGMHIVSVDGQEVHEYADAVKMFKGTNNPTVVVRYNPAKIIKRCIEAPINRDSNRYVCQKHHTSLETSPGRLPCTNTARFGQPIRSP